VCKVVVQGYKHINILKIFIWKWWLSICNWVSPSKFIENIVTTLYTVPVPFLQDRGWSIGDGTCRCLCYGSILCLCIFCNLLL